MKQINNINSQRFSYNGVEYFKNFISKVIGNTITVYNAYDSRDVLFENELYSNIQINGNIYGSAALTQSNLLSVIYTRDSLNGIVQTSGYFNRFTNYASFNLIGQNLLIFAGWAWEIQGFPYSKEDQTTINIPYSTSGKHRIDVILADTNNNFYLVQGQEVLLANSPAEPAPVPNTLKLTSITVNDSSYGTPTDPSIGGTVAITETVLTYTSSLIFTIPQNKQIVSVVVGEVRSLPSSKYTYTPSLATNNFEITDTEFISNLDSGTTIIIKTI